jgi:nitrite reductase (NADH) large subunit
MKAGMKISKTASLSRWAFLRAAGKGGLSAGAVLAGDTDDAAWYLKLIRERTPIAAFRSSLAFGEAYCSPPDKLAA